VLGKFDPGNPKVHALRQSLSDAYGELQEAHLTYERALSIADSPPNSINIVALQQAGKAYAKAVVRYSHAVMAWLAMVDMSR
jgi:hypothetical protein